jgi:hypothetical protein
MACGASNKGLSLNQLAPCHEIHHPAFQAISKKARLK